MAEKSDVEYAVETQGLEKVFKNVRALKGVNLKVPVGSAFGLLGPNGAGKSTLVKTLLSIVSPTRGTAQILGLDIEFPEARKHVGYLPEGHRFPQYLTGRGVCRYFGKLSGLKGEELEKEVDEKIALVGMTQWADSKISKYSKGMAQRIGLAQAMVGNPKLVFLDEPTDGVDPVGRSQIRQVIKDLCGSGTTVFLNSHLLLEVEQICDHVAIMHHGSILQQGSVDDIRSAVKLDKKKMLVKFSTGEVTKQIKKKLDEIASVSESAGGFTLAVSDPELTTKAIDLLREHKVSIYAIEPARANLEDAFIDLISQQDDQSVGGTA